MGSVLVVEQSTLIVGGESIHVSKKTNQTYTWMNTSTHYGKDIL